MTENDRPDLYQVLSTERGAEFISRWMAGLFVGGLLLFLLFADLPNLWAGDTTFVQYAAHSNFCGTAGSLGLLNLAERFAPRIWRVLTWSLVLYLATYIAVIVVRVYLITGNVSLVNFSYWFVAGLLALGLLAVSLRKLRAGSKKS